MRGGIYARKQIRRLKETHEMQMNRLQTVRDNGWVHIRALSRL